MSKNHRHSSFGYQRSTRCSSDVWCCSLSDCSVVYRSLQSLFWGCSGVDMWCFFHHPISRHRSTSFWCMSFCDIRYEPLIGMCCMCVRVYGLFWMYAWSENLWGIAFGLEVRQIALCWYWSYAWFCLPIFGSVDLFREVSVQTTSMELGSYLYLSCTSYTWRSRVIQRFI